MGLLLEPVPDRIEHGIAVFGDLVIPDAQDGEAFRIQRFVAGDVVIVSVLAAIELDDQASGIAYEISDVGPDGSLTAELVPGKPAILEDEPHRTRGLGGVAAHGFS